MCVGYAAATRSSGGARREGGGSSGSATRPSRPRSARPRRCCASGAARYSPPTGPTSRRRPGTARRGDDRPAAPGRRAARRARAPGRGDRRRSTPLEREIGSAGRCANGLVVTRAADPDRHRRRELRGAAERRARRRRPAAEEPERRGAAHRRRRAAHRHRARRRRASPRARAGRAAAGGGRARALADREGARVLVSMPSLVPLVILRGQRPEHRRARPAGGPERRAHARARRGRRRALRPRGRRAASKALALAEASLDRLGVCNRLNLALVDRGASGVARAAARLFRAKGLEVRGDVPGARAARPAARPRVGERPRARRDRHGRPGRRPRGGAADRERGDLGLAAGIVTEDEEAAERFLDGYRGTAAFWHAPTRFTDGFELTGAPETGINVDRRSGPARAGHLPRPVASPVPGDRRRKPAR